MRSARARWAAALIVAVVCGVDASAQANPKPAALSNGAVAGQIATGIVGTAVGFVGGGVTTRWIAGRLGAGEDGAARAGYAGAYLGGAFLTAVGPALIGRRDNAAGSYMTAVGGAAAGGIVALGVKELGSRGAFGDSGFFTWIAGIVVVALPSVGATVAYNSTR